MDDSIIDVLERHMMKHMKKRKKWLDLHGEYPDELDNTFKDMIIDLHKFWATIGITCKWMYKQMILRTSVYCEEKYDIPKHTAMHLVKDLFQEQGLHYIT